MKRHVHEAKKQTASAKFCDALGKCVKGYQKANKYAEIAKNLYREATGKELAQA